ncbi:MAG TPA: hypothetical protein VGM01_05305 [Ktedonobacteraceae bacterium]
MSEKKDHSNVLIASYIVNTPPSSTETPGCLDQVRLSLPGSVLAISA